MSPVIHDPPFVDPTTMEEKADEVRRQVNSQGIPVDPFIIATQLGIEVMDVTFEDRDVEGVLRFRNNRAQILLRKASNLARKKFTVAHEVGHFVLHWEPDDEPHGEHQEFVDSDMQLYRRGMLNPLSKSDRNREIQANMFAAALLMPRDALEALIPQQPSIKYLARSFGVSEIAMTFRINELDVW